MSHLIKIYTVCKCSYFRLWYLRVNGALVQQIKLLLLKVNYYVCVCVCVCVPILVTTFPDWHSGTEPLPHCVRLVFCVHMYSFAGLIRRTPPPMFSDTAITDRHSDTTIFQLRAHWVRISWPIGSEKSFGHVPPVGVEPSTSCAQGEHRIH